MLVKVTFIPYCMEKLSSRPAKMLLPIAIFFLQASFRTGRAADLANCTITRALDVAVIFDASESIANRSLGMVKDYIINLIKIFDIEGRDQTEGVRVAVFAHTYDPIKFCDFASCFPENKTLDIISKIKPMGFTAVNIAKMLAFVGNDVFVSMQGARWNDTNVKKIAIIILDSSPLPYIASPAQIQQVMKSKNIQTLAVVIEDSGVRVPAITPFLNGPAFAVPTKKDLPTFSGVRDELKSRYGCSKCHPSPCKNNSTCEDELLPPYYSCKCEAGWKGTNCEIEDTCALCKANGGFCFKLPASSTIKCQCGFGRIGSHCQFLDPCFPLPGPCKNSATCTPNTTAANDYSCSCVGNFTGKDCGIPTSGPCAGNPCNDHTCVETSASQHRCVCPSYCTSPPDCSTCKKIEPCKPNPCLNGCHCRDSPDHEDGFTCSSPVGHLGKLCDLGKAEVKCEPTYIEVKIPEKAVKEYEAGIGGTLVYLSPTTKNLYGCVAELDPSQKKRVVKMSAPFQDCGTTKTPFGDGSEYSNTVWLNRASSVLDMPVPLLKFKCVYGNSQKVVSSGLRPAFGNIPVLAKSGDFDVQMEAYMRAPGVKDRGHITRGSVYTVGDMVYLTASLKPNSTSGGLVLKMQDCYASPTPTLHRGKVDLVTNGCPSKEIEVSMMGNAQQTSSTIGFKTFQLRDSQTVYYCCKVIVCKRNDLACEPTECPPTRSKRSADIPKSNILRVGPLIIVDLGQPDIAAGVDHQEKVPVVISGDILEKKGEGPGVKMEVSEISYMHASYLVVATLASFIVLVLLSTIVLCVVIQKKRDHA